MLIVFIAIAATIGAVVAGLLGWFGSGEVFNPRKFWPTILRAVIAGGIVAVSYPLIQTLGLWTGLIGAFLTGAGVDVLGNRLAGSITATGPTTISPPK
ncbi:MAG: hypothetical protein MUO61_03360 [Dehalococcoidia bacterium]|nr:hypothetical protein [Dehalococcoidia bacterium]